MDFSIYTSDSYERDYLKTWIFIVYLQFQIMYSRRRTIGISPDVTLFVALK